MKENKKENNKMEKIISLCKRRGFIYQGSEIYGGLAGTWDYGPLGVALRNNIRNLWWKRFVEDREDMYGIDAAILMNQNVWKASGHVAGFADPLVEDVKTKKRFRADHLLEEAGVDVKGMKLPEMNAKIRELKLKSPDGNDLGEARQFNMMLRTHVGATEDDAAISYLRPETAGGMFVNFKNILDSFHPKLPFGTAQIGKAFRNEIAPRDFTFRSREFEQMEIEYFVNPRDWEKTFEHFVEQVHEYTKDIGLDQSKVHELEVAPEDRAHYSKRTIDFEFDYPFGRKELYGLAYRTDFDLTAHTNASKVDLSYFDEESKERFLPHVIEPSFGLDRTVLAVLSDAYCEEKIGAKPVSVEGEGGSNEGGEIVDGGETRVFLKFSPPVAPIKVAVFPLLKNKPQLVEKAREIYKELRTKISGGVMFDDNGNIGKRYRRQDEIGTPFCVTVDFETIEKGNGVTIRNRDTGEQERIAEKDLIQTLTNGLK
ncbi:MAG TPA: glycine--tRNA ligase [Candidatus Paceibacterota bacterium]|nr:glycine--tRNA ligase [Candidatus Paceibacterota bacterium]